MPPYILKGDGTLPTDTQTTLKETTHKTIELPKNKQLNRIYLAAPFFDDVPDTIEGQQDRIDAAKAYLELNSTVGYVYSPLEHQSKEIFGTSKWRTETFNSDARHVANADAVVAIMAYNENGSIDDGVAFEVGLAYALNIPVIFVEQEHEGFPTNLMLSESGTAFVDETMELLTYDFNDLKPQKYEGQIL